MPDALLYLLQVNTAVLAFYLLYRLVFRSLTFYKANRFILLLGLLFSLLYPFLELPKLFKQPLVIHEGYSFALQVEGWPVASLSQEAGHPNYWDWIHVLFWGISALLLLRLLLRLFSLYLLHAKTTPAHYQRYRFRKVCQAVSPFSFWRTIYLNPDCHQAEELDAILQHEKVHTDEFHTLDVLVAEVLLLFCWFNPAMWLIKKAVGENLEFITDQRLLQRGIESKAYQYYLLKISRLSQASSLATNFTFITIKTRIRMMNKRKSNPLHMLKYALLLPLVSGLMYACTLGDEPVEDLLPNEPGIAEGTSFSEAIFYLDGRESSQAEVNELNPEEIATVEIFKGEQAINTFGKKGEKGVVMVATKPNSQPQDPQASSIKIRNSKDASTSDENPIAEAYFLIDGKEASMAEVEGLSADKIATINVWKDQEAVARFGSKGENGVVSITTK
jgi:hypothetical protein